MCHSPIENFSEVEGEDIRKSPIKKLCRGHQNRLTDESTVELTLLQSWGKETMKQRTPSHIKGEFTWLRQTVQNAAFAKGMTKIPNRCWGGSGVGILIFVPAGKAISLLCPRKKGLNWPISTNSKNINKVRTGIAHPRLRASSSGTHNHPGRLDLPSLSKAEGVIHKDSPLVGATLGQERSAPRAQGPCTGSCQYKTADRFSGSSIAKPFWKSAGSPRSVFSPKPDRRF